jgi:shikimate dehydrogenase
MFSYDLIDSPTIEEAMEIFLREGYSGANVTSPYKESVLKYCTSWDPFVSKIGAANLILFNRGALHCHNTDYYGVKNSLEAAMVKESRALVVGAGGAAKAAIIALKEMKIDVTIINRTDTKAQELAKALQTDWLPLENFEKAIREFRLLIYTIDAPIAGLERVNLMQHTVLEANYKTPLFSDNKCNKYISGKEWLISQAIPSFKLFTQMEPDRQAMFEVAVNC